MSDARGPSARRSPAPIVIEGISTVIARRPLPVEAAAPHGPGVDFVPPQPKAFGRRPEHRRPPERDLVFQGAAARPFGDRRPHAGTPADALSFFDRASLARTGAARPRRLAGAAAALALLVLPAGLVAGPVGTAIATPDAASAPLVIDELVTSIRPRGSGAVLSVEGLIRNVSGGPAAVPPLRIALAEAGGGLRTKALSTGVGRLAAGRTLRFHSTVAVAKETSGEIAVDFILASPGPGRPPSGKTLVE